MRMMDARFLAALDRFEEIRLDEKVTAAQTAMFYRIAMAFRKAGYPVELAISTAELARQERISTDSVLLIRKRLEELGVIGYIPGTVKNEAAKYVLDLPNNLPNNLPNDLPMLIISTVGNDGRAADDAQNCAERTERGESFARAGGKVLPDEGSINNNINKPKDPEIEGFKGGKRRKNAKAAEADERFAAFWAECPRKVGKQDAIKAWAKLRMSDELYKSIMDGLTAAKKQWAGLEPKYIPHPSKWLNGRRWEDEIEVPFAEKPMMPGGRRSRWEDVDY